MASLLLLRLDKVQGTNIRTGLPCDFIRVMARLEPIPSRILIDPEDPSRGTVVAPLNEPDFLDESKWQSLGSWATPLKAVESIFAHMSRNLT